MSMEWSRARLRENQARQCELIKSEGAGRWLGFSMSHPVELQLRVKADSSSLLPFVPEATGRDQEKGGCQQVESGSPQNRMA
jgi:hypothetical protein